MYYCWHSWCVAMVILISSTKVVVCKLTSDFTYAIGTEEHAAVTVTRLANQPDQFLFHNNVGDENSNENTCVTMYGLEQQCTCNDNNQTYFVSKATCLNTLNECMLCLNGEDVQIPLIDLHDKEQSTTRIIHHCAGIPPPPAFFPIEEDENSGEQRNCENVRIEYDGGLLNGESFWRSLNTVKSDFKFSVVNEYLRWTGTRCELDALSGLILKLHLHCRSCLVVKTQGNKTFCLTTEDVVIPSISYVSLDHVKYNDPDEIASEFDKCQLTTTSSTTKLTRNSKLNPSKSETVVTGTNPSWTAKTTTYAAASPTLTISSSIHESTPKLRSTITSCISTLPLHSSSTLNEVTPHSSQLVPTLSSSLDIVASVINPANMNYEYPDIRLEGNNDIIITAAGVSVGITFFMVLVTMVMITRRNKRESEEEADYEYTASDHSVYDDRNRSESMFETARKRYVVERFGFPDHNLNQAYVVPAERRKESILMNSAIGNDGNVARCRSVTRTSTLSVASNSSNEVVTNKTATISTVATKQICSTYAGLDIPSILNAIPEEVQTIQSGTQEFSKKRRSTWHILDRRKRKEFNIQDSRKHTLVNNNVDLMKYWNKEQNHTVCYPVPQETNISGTPNEQRQSGAESSDDEADCEADNDLQAVYIQTNATSRKHSDTTPEDNEVGENA